MGSPISVAPEEITMQKIEQLVFIYLPCDISLWIRYINNVLANVPLDQNEILLQHLNNQNPHIQFTYEKENHFSLLFLDMIINRK